MTATDDTGPADPTQDDITRLFSLGLGPWLTALRGKIPVFDKWQTLPPVDEPTVRDWLDAGYSLGFRTGPRSGLVVIDDDQPREGGGDYTPPPTGLISESPTGGRHYYYRCPDPAPRNSASLIAPHVDVRGEGGQVVVPPSVHVTAGRSYRWVSTGEPGTFPELPAKPATVRIDLTAPTTAGQGYAAAALHREVHAVRTCPEGARNDTLNRAAFNLGQLCAGGELSEQDVHHELTAAAALCGLPPAEAAATIRSGLAGGREHPRAAPEPRSQPATATAQPSAPRDVLVPGSHILPGGEYVEQGNHDFAERTLAKLEPGAVYRRAGVLGEIHDDQFKPVAVNRLRSIIDSSVRLVAGKPPKSDEDEPTIVYRTCSRDHAAVVSDYGQVRGAVRELRHLARHPVCIGDDFTLASPGWNADGGVFLTDDIAPEHLPLDEARAVLEDLVCDFPFQAPADRANFFGLMLTPILRPALRAPVPMHLILAPVERTGKSKLAELVLGLSIAGRALEAAQFGDREEEREKRILSVLLQGQTLWHLDNLTEFLGSAALASLLTCREYQGRVLGSSLAPTVPNGLTIVGSGNNVHATGEITKRIVPIRLLPDTENPEDRTDFRHPDLDGFVLESRPRVLGALLGMIDAWKAAGRPLHGTGFGGFERWTAVVGGILGVAGYPEWLSTMREWRGGTDDTGQETRSLVEAWWGKWADHWVPSSDLYELAVSMDLFGWLDKAKTDRARRTSFGIRVINRLNGQVIGLPASCGGVRVVSDGVGSKRRVRLDVVEREG